MICPTRLLCASFVGWSTLPAMDWKSRFWLLLNSMPLWAAGDVLWFTLALPSPCLLSLSISGGSLEPPGDFWKAKLFLTVSSLAVEPASLPVGERLCLDLAPVTPLGKAARGAVW